MEKIESNENIKNIAEKHNRCVLLHRLSILDSLYEGSLLKELLSLQASTKFENNVINTLMFNVGETFDKLLDITTNGLNEKYFDSVLTEADIRDVNSPVVNNFDFEVLKYKEFRDFSQKEIDSPVSSIFTQRSSRKRTSIPSKNKSFRNITQKDIYQQVEDSNVVSASSAGGSIPSKIMNGGAIDICNGIYTEEHTFVNLLLGLTKTLDELVHDFNKKEYLHDHINVISTNYKENIDSISNFFDRSLPEKNSDSLKKLAQSIVNEKIILDENEPLKDKEWNYYTSMLNFYDTACGLDSIEMVKTVNIEGSPLFKTFKKEDIDKYIKNGYIYKMESSSSKDSAEDNVEDKASQYFYCSLSQELDKVEPTLNDELIYTYFQDNPTPYKKLLPLVESDINHTNNFYGINAVQKFLDRRNEIKYAAGLVDPATTGSIGKTVIRNHDIDLSPLDTAAKERKVKSSYIQYLQDLNNANCITSRKIMADCLNEFMGYFGAGLVISKNDSNKLEIDESSTITINIEDPVNKAFRDTENAFLKIFNQGMTDMPKKDNPFFDYIKYKENTTKATYTPNNIEHNFKILFIEEDGKFSGIIFNPGTNNQNVFQLKVGDFTIKNISDFFNFFNKESPSKPIPSTLTSKHTQDANWRDSWTRLHKFSKYIFNNSFYVKKLNENMTKRNVSQDKITNRLNWFFTQIVISLKSLGDSMQVKYVKKMYDYIDSLNSSLQFYISSSDKNVAGESIFYKTPFIINGTGIRPHSKLFTKYTSFFEKKSEEANIKALFNTTLQNVKMADGKTISNTELTTSKAITHNLGSIDLSSIIEKLFKITSRLNVFYDILSKKEGINLEKIPVNNDDLQKDINEISKYIDNPTVSKNAIKEFDVLKTDLINVIYVRLILKQIKTLFSAALQEQVKGFEYFFDGVVENYKNFLQNMENNSQSFGVFYNNADNLNKTIEIRNTFSGTLGVLEMIVNDEDDQKGKKNTVAVENNLFIKIQSTIHKINHDTSFNLLSSCNFAKMLKDYTKTDIAGFYKNIDTIKAQFNTSMTQLKDIFEDSKKNLTPVIIETLLTPTLTLFEKNNVDIFKEFGIVIGIIDFAFNNINVIEESNYDETQKKKELKKAINDISNYIKTQISTLDKILRERNTKSSVIKMIKTQLNSIPSYYEKKYFPKRSFRSRVGVSYSDDSVLIISKIDEHIKTLNTTLSQRKEELNKYLTESQSDMEKLNVQIAAKQKASRSVKALIKKKQNLIKKINKEQAKKEEKIVLLQNMILKRETERKAKETVKRLTNEEIYDIVDKMYVSINDSILENLQEMDRIYKQLTQQISGGRPNKTRKRKYKLREGELPKLRKISKKKAKHSYKLNNSSFSRRKALNEGVSMSVAKRGITPKKAATAKKRRLNMQRIYRRYSNIDSCNTITDDMAYLDKKYKLGKTVNICGKKKKRTIKKKSVKTQR